MNKIVFAGATNVGKTSIIYSFDHDKKYSGQTTIGAIFSRKIVNDVTLDIWDTAGQERYQSVAPHYFRKACICVLVFDINSKESFDKLYVWKSICDDANSENAVKYILVANKLDLNKYEVPDDDIYKFRKKNNILHYIGTSAYTKSGINDLFDLIVSLCNKNVVDNSNIVNLKRSNIACNCN